METIKNLYIYGKSGHGKVVRDIALSCGYTNIIYIDDDKNKQNVLAYDKNLDKNIPFIVAIGDNFIRAKIMKKILKDGFRLTSLVHKSAIVSNSAYIGLGVVVMPLVVINADVRIENGCILNSKCVIEHDCVLKKYVHVSPNAALAGNVHVGKYTHVGISSCVIQNIKIGSKVILAAGSVCVCDVPKKVLAMGIPCKIKRKI